MTACLLLVVMLSAGQMALQAEPKAPGDGLLTNTESASAGFSNLPLTPEVAAELKEALDTNDLKTAQRILLKRLDEVSQPDQRRLLLLPLGTLYFLSHDSLQAAIAWQKAAHIGPLPERISFSLAMAYVQIGHEDWAMKQLTTLRSAAPQQALYPFWMGRIAYDQKKYTEAAAFFRDALRLDPTFSRAHDNLGLCLFDENDVEGSIREHQRAIELQKDKPNASAWPYLNLGIAEQFRGQSQAAMEAFQHALALNPSFAQAHYRLGSLYAASSRLLEALAEFKAAIKADPLWAEPHAALARVDRRMGDDAGATEQVKLYQRMKEKGSEVNREH